MVTAVNQSGSSFPQCQPKKFDNAESRPTKVGPQKKLADFMSDDRFLSVDIVGEQKSAIVGRFLVRVTSALLYQLMADFHRHVSVAVSVAVTVKKTVSVYAVYVVAARVCARQ